MINEQFKRLDYAKISRKEYDRLKTMCQSKNIADVNLAGVLVSELRRNKKLPLRLVNNLYACIAKQTSIFMAYHGTHEKYWLKEVYYNKIDYGSEFQLKQFWLNGALR